jgi:hypothetical protein
MKLTLYNFSLLLPFFFSFIGCGYIRIEKNQYGEPVLNDRVKYSFSEIPTEVNLKAIDTSAYYIQIFEDRYYSEDEKKNPQILQFHNDGFFKRESQLTFGQYDANRTKNSIYYGGKYRIKENTIEIEEFLPSTGGATNYYIRNIKRGAIIGNRITFDGNNSPVMVFEKKQKSH